ncbi:ABC transporter substrate-binding protein [Halorhabdus tiamatea]|nr:ABC transporter substrate-binding protein [Halorhabdus tiamatea]
MGVAKSTSIKGVAGVEIAHAWAEGDGKRPLESLLEGFESRHPDVTVTDQYYPDLSLTVKSRILSENPPSTWVEWPGESLTPYMEASVLADISELWTETDMSEAYLEGPQNLARIDGEYVAVPINIHRLNSLFYNTELVEEHGLDPGRIESPRAFLDVLEEIDTDSVIGLQQPMKNPWTVLQLFSMLLIGQFGPETYRNVTGGDGPAYENEIRETVTLLDRYADLASEDATFLGMVEANEQFIDGESIFFTQGDWVAGTYRDIEGFDYGSEWDHVPFPGTDGVYAMGMDAIVASADQQGEKDTRTFLEFVGSPTALQAYNKEKGAIPPRRDVAIDGYPPFLQDQYRDFKQSGEQVGSDALETHPERFVDAKAALARFVAERDVESTTQDFLEAYS